MKKLFALLILLPALFLTSCSKDDDEKDGGGGTNTPINIVGKWDYLGSAAEVKTSDKGADHLLKKIYEKELKEGFIYTRYEFTDNGKFIFYRKKDGDYVKESSGTYKLTDNKKLELTYTEPVALKEEYTIIPDVGSVTMVADDKRGKQILETEGYPGWQTVEITQIQTALVFLRFY